MSVLSHNNSRARSHAARNSSFSQGNGVGRIEGAPVWQAEEPTRLPHSKNISDSNTVPCGIGLRATEDQVVEVQSWVSQGTGEAEAPGRRRRQRRGTTTCALGSIKLGGGFAVVFPVRDCGRSGRVSFVDATIGLTTMI